MTVKGVVDSNVQDIDFMEKKNVQFQIFEKSCLVDFNFFFKLFARNLRELLFIAGKIKSFEN